MFQSRVRTLIDFPVRGGAQLPNSSVEDPIAFPVCRVRITSRHLVAGLEGGARRVQLRGSKSAGNISYTNPARPAARLALVFSFLGRTINSENFTSSATFVLKV